MLKIVFTFALVAMAVAEIPSYLPTCSRNDPKLDTCVIDCIEGLRPKLREGMPELGAPPIEPFAIKAIKLADEATFKAVAENVDLYGLPDFKIQSLHLDLEKQKINFELIFERVTFKANYNVSAVVLVPISGRGPIDMVADGVKATVAMKYQLIEKKGDKYFFFSSMTIKLNIKDYTSNFTPNEGEDSILASAVNSILQNSRQEIIRAMIPDLEKTVTELFLGLANKIGGHLTYDEALPDRK